MPRSAAQALSSSRPPSSQTHTVSAAQLLDLNIQSQPGELVFRASGASSLLPIDAGESGFAYQRLQMSVRKECEQSELCYLEVLRMMHEFHLLWLWNSVATLEPTVMFLLHV